MGQRKQDLENKEREVDMQALRQKTQFEAMQRDQKVRSIERTRRSSNHPLPKQQQLPKSPYK
jgi:hypothetical protein